MNTINNSDEVQELLEFFGEPSQQDDDSVLWSTDSLLNSVFYKDCKIYISIGIKKKLLYIPYTIM